MSGLKRHDIPKNVEVKRWALDIQGSVERPLHLERSDLAAFPAETFTDDFACVEGWTAEGLSWRGIRVEELLDRAEPTPEGKHALVHGLDGDYACSFSINRLSESILALELDGEPLAPEHGGPVRLISSDSDSDCWESIKWVSKIEVTTSPLSARDTAKEIALQRIE